MILSISVEVGVRNRDEDGLEYRGLDEFPTSLWCDIVRKVELWSSWRHYELVVRVSSRVRALLQNFS